jgi:hypothetical protein
MKKIQTVLLALGFFLCGQAQQDTALHTRLAAFMQVNEAMDMEKVMDYTYPKLFTLVPREQMIEVMHATFENEEMTIKLDSLKIDSIYPEFTLPEGRFAKVTYSMKMIMQMKKAADDTLTAEEFDERNEEVASYMRMQYGEDKVYYNKETNSVVLYIQSPMLAIKDEHSPQWTFINLKDEDPMMDMLLSKDVQKALTNYP